MMVKRLMVFGIAIASFAAGSIVTAQVDRDRYRVFDLRIYHAVPGKVPKLVARFQDAVPLFEKHHLDVLGYWVPVGDRPRLAGHVRLSPRPSQPG